MKKSHENRRCIVHEKISKLNFEQKNSYLVTSIIFETNFNRQAKARRSFFSPEKL